MKVSLDWLNQYVDLHDLTAEQIGAALTDLGLELETITRTGSIDPQVVVGHVTACAPHPNADALRLCQVNVGEDEPLQIVCGAPNARQGIYVAVARVGAVLPGDFKIKKSKIRGEASFGMMCSGKELGVSSEDDGIIELPGEPQVGKEAGQALGASDTVLELGLTPNRADCNGYIGVARDLAAKLKRPLKLPPFAAPRDPSVKTAGKVEVRLQDSEGCGRFVALHVEGLTPSPSPNWMQRRLENSGMRPINLVVDVTNYVMLEMSQPIHAYDERDLAGGVIEIRKAKDGETIKTLDGQTRSLLTSDLVICDAERPIAVAGVMGGETSEVKDDTTNIVIEVAFFNPIMVRKSARRLGLHTEASHRFERGVDISRAADTALRVAGLLLQCAEELGLPSPRVASDVVDAYPHPASPKNIALRLERVRQILAMPLLSVDDIKACLQPLQLEMIDRNEERMVFTIPPWRHDVEREIDIIDEIGRLIGLEKIPYLLPSMNLRPTPEDPFIGFQDQIRDLTAGLGFSETISFPFLAAGDIKSLRLSPGHPLYPSLTLQNPLSEDQRYMQTHLLPVLLRALLENRRRGEAGAQLFEVGRGFYDFHAHPLDTKAWPSFQTWDQHGRHISERARRDEKRPIEHIFLAGIMDHPFEEKTWQRAAVAVDFYRGKQVIEALASALGIRSLRFVPIPPDEFPFLHPGASAQIQDGRTPIGYVGELHPETVFDLDLGADSAPVVFEIELERLFNAKAKKLKIDTTIQRFPPASRDVAFQVDAARSHADFEASIKKFNKKKNLSRYTLFDVYQGDNLPVGKKSLAYTFFFQSADRTLTDKEVDGEIGALVAWLGNELGATQR